MVMDADMLYTKSRLDTILTSRICTVDSDCVFFDCASKCNNATGYCTQRTNNNVDVSLLTATFSHIQEGRQKIRSNIFRKTIEHRIRRL